MEKFNIDASSVKNIDFYDYVAVSARSSCNCNHLNLYLHKSDGSSTHYEIANDVDGVVCVDNGRLEVMCGSR